jgi:SAM-dependent methyltransferase
MAEPFDYVRHHVGVVARDLADAREKRVLVVGCNRGREVSLFLEAGAQEVWGMDVMDDVGIEYPHERARYVTMSAEAMDLDEGMFDIVFCLATMEHISRPEAAFPEISRVVAPGGFVYVLSAPLWHSREGHHKSDIFDVDRYPWIHLRFDAETLTRMCESGEIEYPESVEDVAAHVDYMMNAAFFNQRSARDYVRICSELADLVIERNDLHLEPEIVLELLPDGDRAELIDRVGGAIELRAVTHTFVARKPPGLPSRRRASTSVSALRARLRLRTRLRGLLTRGWGVGGRTRRANRAEAQGGLATLACSNRFRAGCS